MKLKTFTDGGARGNPGPAAVGVMVCDEQNEILAEYSETIGEATNNVAEYSALIKGLQQAEELAIKLGKDVNTIDLTCHLDSELVVKQLNGLYKLKNYNLQKLFDEVRKAERKFKRVSYAHLRREDDGMRRADQLVNYALDEAERKSKRRVTE